MVIIFQYVYYILNWREKMIDLYSQKRRNMNQIWSKTKSARRWVVFFGATLILASGCQKDDPPENYKNTNEIVQQIMYYAYYWNDKIDDKLASRSGFLPVPVHTKPNQYFSSLLYDKTMAPSGSMEYDRWSFLIPYKEFEEVMVAGEYKSFGYFLAQTPDRSSVRVCYVYEDSPMSRAGIERGYELRRLNGTDVMTFIRNNTINDELNKESNRFVFADREGNVLPEKTVSKAVVKINPILAKERYAIDGREAGYIVYNSFISASKEAITAALKEFGDVDELIFDLRYNGGGDVYVADAICELLLPASVGTDSIDFAKYIFSERTNLYSKELELKDEVRKIKRNANALDISRLFVIVSDMTASASEEVVNCLKPFVNEVILVGAPTEGKPTGMNVFVDDRNNPQWAIAPVTFRIDNALGEGSYYSGFTPTYRISDDLYRNFGADPQTLEGEACLEAVLRFIQSGTFPASASVKTFERATPRIIRLEGIQIHAGCM